jgi:flagellar assembly protein FliH
MKATANYLFEDDFATGEKPTISVIEAERRRADAESVAYRKRFAAGEEKARNEIAQKLAAAVTLVADGMGRVEKRARFESEAVEVAVAVAIGSKFAPELIARQPFVEIAALATECVRHLTRTPHVAVRVTPELYEGAKYKLEEIATAGGFEGRLLVLSEVDLTPGDCRVERTEGGINRDRSAVEPTINVCVTRYLGAKIEL